MKLLKLSLIVFCMLAMPLAALDYISAADKGHLPWWLVIGFMMMLPPWYYVLVKELKQLVFVLPLFLCVSAHAATLPPFPTVKRPAPLLSPRAASAPKTTPMVKFTPASELPRLPMTGFYRRANSMFGRHELTASALQPANQAILFEVAPVPAGAWVPLAWFSPYPVSQPVFAALYSNEERLFIRATATPQPPAELRITEASFVGAPRVRVNPLLPGSQAWVAPKLK